MIKRFYPDGRDLLTSYEPDDSLSPVTKDDPAFVKQTPQL